MLPKTRRIERKSFPHILQTGKRFSSANFLLYVSKIDASEASPSRFSFSVSKKVQKKATDRNTYRRRGYSAVKNVLENVRPGHFFFFAFKKSQVKPTFAVLEKEIGGLLREANMIV